MLKVAMLGNHGDLYLTADADPARLFPPVLIPAAATPG